MQEKKKLLHYMKWRTNYDLIRKETKFLNFI